jgi:hypothetical protein
MTTDDELRDAVQQISDDELVKSARMTLDAMAFLDIATIRITLTEVVDRFEATL